VIVLDTNALVWVTVDDRRLGRKAGALVDKHWAAGKIAVSSIAFWEIGLLEARRRLRLPAPVREWRKSLLDAGVIELPIDGAVALRSLELSGLPDDPADRWCSRAALARTVRPARRPRRPLHRRDRVGAWGRSDDGGRENPGLAPRAGKARRARLGRGNGGTWVHLLDQSRDTETQVPCPISPAGAIQRKCMAGHCIHKINRVAHAPARCTSTLRKNWQHSNPANRLPGHLHPQAGILRPTPTKGPEDARRHHDHPRPADRRAQSPPAERSRRTPRVGLTASRFRGPFRAQPGLYPGHPPSSRPHRKPPSRPFPSSTRPLPRTSSPSFRQNFASASSRARRRRSRSSGSATARTPSTPSAASWSRPTRSSSRA